VALPFESSEPESESQLPPGLSGDQREAVLAADRQLCVLAGAGAGKTRVLTLRVARRVHDATALADRVLVCTFSRKAADEIGSRLWALDVAPVRSGTFHRLALSLIRQHRIDRGAGSVAVAADRRRLVAEVLEEAAHAGGGSGRELPVALVESEIGWAKARLVAPEHYEAEAKTHQRRVQGSAVASLYDAYETLKARRGVLDLDDLLLRCADILEGDRAFAQAVRWRYRHLFVDEMQDVNPAQFRLLRLLCSDDGDLFTVGDPHQAVYGWNGADPSLLADLPARMPGTRVLRLDDNHRSSPQIVRTATAVLEANDRVPRSLRPDGPVPQVRAHDDEHAEADWVAGQVWLSHRPGRRWEHIAVLARTNAQLRTVGAALDRQRIPWRHAGHDLGPASDLDREEAATAEAGLLHQDRPPAPSIPHDGPSDAVVLSTFHRAKGLQWPAVFVIGLSDAFVPIPTARTTAARAEERRLLYVALSRAEDELWCSWARGAGDDERRGEAGPSPWLADIEQTLRLLELENRPVGPEVAAHHVAKLRALVAASGAQFGDRLSAHPAPEERRLP
jgi:DNA helicase II / ATP-dependent DNA helicase PcrA